MLFVGFLGFLQRLFFSFERFVLFADFLFELFRRFTRDAVVVAEFVEVTRSGSQFLAHIGQRFFRLHDFALKCPELFLADFAAFKLRDDLSLRRFQRIELFGGFGNGIRENILLLCQ